MRYQFEPELEIARFVKLARPSRTSTLVCPEQQYTRTLGVNNLLLNITKSKLLGCKENSTGQIFNFCKSAQLLQL